MSNENPEQQGSLERLGIQLETLPTEGVLTPGTVKSARFRISKPSGYAVKDVEDFIFDIVQPTLAWYSEALHKRDLDVFTLGEELDKAEVDLVNLRYQVQALEYGSKVQEGVALNQEDKEVSDLLERFQELQQQHEATLTQIEQLQTYTKQQDDYIDVVLAQLEGGQSEQEAAPEPLLAVSSEVVEEIEEAPVELVREEPEAYEETPIPLEEVEEVHEQKPATQPIINPYGGGILPPGIRPEDL